MDPLPARQRILEAWLAWLLLGMFAFVPVALTLAFLTHTFVRPWGQRDRDRLRRLDDMRRREAIAEAERQGRHTLRDVDAWQPDSPAGR